MTSGRPQHQEYDRMLQENVCDIVFESNGEIIESCATLSDKFTSGKTIPISNNKNSCFIWDLITGTWLEFNFSNLQQFEERLKPCTRCEKYKPVSAFRETDRRRSEGKFTWYAQCKECESMENLNQSERMKLNKDLLKFGKFFCRLCCQVKSLGVFQHRDDAKGHDTECRDCTSNGRTLWWSPSNKNTQKIIRKLKNYNRPKENLARKFISLYYNGILNLENINFIIKLHENIVKREVSMWSRSPEFRKEIRLKFNNTCCITNICGDKINEACHIEAFCEKQNNNLDNGLYMTRNSHALFDNDLLIIDGECRVFVHPEYRCIAGFREIHGEVLVLPDSVNRKLLDERYVDSSRNYERQVNNWRKLNPEAKLSVLKPFE